MTLNDLKKNEKAIIISVDLEKIPIKLCELGCIEQNKVEIVQIAPLKCPIYVNINGNFVSIRRELAQYINVEKISI